LENSLSSLQQLNVPKDLAFELIVVDNNSTDDTKRVVKTFLSESKIKIRYVFEADQGLSNSRNRGIKETERDILVFTDDDMEFDPNWLLEISNIFKKYDCICVAGKIIPKWPIGKPPWLIDDGPYQIPSFDGRFDLGNHEHEIKKPPFGGNMAFKRTAFEKYGFFRTDLGLSGNTLLSNEETEFCSRLFAAGEKIVYSPHAKVYHLLGKSHGRKSYYLNRIFNYGKSNIRMKYESKKVVNDISILYLMKKLYRIAEIAVKWLFTIDTGIRFNRKLVLYRRIGELAESIAIFSRKKFVLK
jgi:GT2 family glycosyltransferase